MRIRNTHVGIAMCSIAAVVAIAVVDMGRPSPGPIAGVHGQIAEMRGGEACAMCHGGWGSSMQQACIECHGAIEEQIDTRAGVHGLLLDGGSGLCASCHVDHHGEDFPVVNARSFARVGVDERGDFGHDRIGFPMYGKHLELECSNCHDNADVEILAEGQVRFLGLEQGCVNCHEDWHVEQQQAPTEQARVTTCVQCHGQDSFTELVASKHEKALPLIGAHADLGCATCHVDDEAHSLDAIGQVEYRETPRSCLDCHSSPHDDVFIDASLGAVTLNSESGCGACHAPEHLSFHDEKLVLSDEQHGFSGFPLDAPHDELSCAQCHDPAFSDFDARYPGRGADECVACHTDPHDGQFDSGAFEEDGCITCHARQQFEPHAFDEILHARTALPLTGRHLDAGCDDCHPAQVGDPLEGVTVFRNASDQCDGCHADAHESYFDSRTRELPAVTHGDCSRCHGTESFGEREEGGFDHGRWTPLAVEGAHLQDGCQVCHTPADSVDAAGRQFGRAELPFGAPVGCASCHADPHRGGFDGAGGDQGDCARCHNQSSFRSLPDGFDHSKWTGFALKGAHDEAVCSACHEPMIRADAVGRTWGKANGAACADCHDTPHGGQFADGAEPRCERCHTNTTDFARLAFRHDLDSSFALGEAHRELACSICHTSDEALARFGAPLPVRFRPLEHRCADCHGGRDEPIHRQLRGRQE